MSNQRSRGFSLVEVILALGLLGMSMISVAFLLTQGARSTKGGRTASEALSVGRTILEEMEGWGFHQAHLAYGYDGSAKTYTVDTRNNSYCAGWQSELDEKLEDGYGIIQLESISSGVSPPVMADTAAIRITVTVYWSEGDRDRNVTLAALKL